MADSKISQLVNGAPWQTTDEFPVARAGANKKLAISDLFTSPVFTGTSGTKITGAAGTGAPAPSGGIVYALDTAAAPFNGGGIVFGAGVGCFAGIKGAISNGAGNTVGFLDFYTRVNTADANLTLAMRVNPAGQFGLGGITPTALLELGSDSAKKPSTNTWTIASDLRLKDDIVAADTQRCYDIVKALPLKRYTWKDSVYSQAAVPDRSKLGWIAQDVAALFPKSVEAGAFNMPPVDDGTEEVLEQEMVQEERSVAVVDVVDGVAVLKIRIDTVSVPLFDSIPVVDEAGNAVMVAAVSGDVEVTAIDAVSIEGAGEIAQPSGAAVGKIQATHQVPRMRTVTRPKVRVDVIEDCLSLNADQVYAAMYGALQHLMAKVELLEAQIAAKA